MINTITQTEIRHLRLQNSLLVNPADRTLAQTVDQLLGIQAQYGNAALLNLYNRIDNIAPQDFQTAVQASPIVPAKTIMSLSPLISINRTTMRGQP